ncbi:MAG: TIGR04283 family arsenosugar biosynthesis glycosyltransferase [Phenylobacterium sp.]|nr:TIGR04283 family arsenosugar biosynthesis glycosyltransferase [Phenylobacterium sp.]
MQRLAAQVAPRLSVIIPTLNAADGLATTLAALPSDAEVIVVDGGSSDATLQVAAAAGAQVLRAPAGRGGQLAAGVAQARAPWMLFLHADTRLDAKAWAALEAFIADGANQDTAAAFGFRLDARAWQARLLEVGVRLRVALLALPYGDQGLLIHRQLYERVGGYRPLPLMEDVDLVQRLGRRRLRILPGVALTSAVRWRRRGWMRQSLLNLHCLALYLTGAPPARIAQIYGR